MAKPSSPTLVAKYGSSYLVFTGTILALATTSLIGILVGKTEGYYAVIKAKARRGSDVYTLWYIVFNCFIIMP